MLFKFEKVAIEIEILKYRDTDLKNCLCILQDAFSKLTNQKKVKNAFNQIYAIQIGERDLWYSLLCKTLRNNNQHIFDA